MNETHLYKPYVNKPTTAWLGYTFHLNQYEYIIKSDIDRDEE